MSMEEAFRKASKKSQTLASTITELDRDASKSEALRKATEAVKRRWAKQDKEKQAKKKQT